MPAGISISTQKLANPSPLGLCAFGITTLVLSLYNAQAFGIKIHTPVMGLALFYGGAVQLIAGIFEFFVNNTFGATAFCSKNGASDKRPKMSAAIINTASLNYARWGALGVGVWWGYTKKASLTRLVKDRNEEAERHHYEDLVEEGKVAFEAAYNREQAAKAAKAGVPAIDADSFKFNGEKWINWAIADSEASAATKKK
ncbi:hypothetical protein HDV05_005698 [Chytridiales sp. JEL 0842]|nr:hypothetical protein HDV05_005698 [Chytridiales sp. JEL 0842]